MKLAEFLYSRSAMSKIEQGCGRSGFGHFFRVHFFQFLSLKSSPDRFLDPGILLPPSSSYFLAIPLLRSRTPHLVQKLCNRRCATPPQPSLSITGFIYTLFENSRQTKNRHQYIYTFPESAPNSGDLPLYNLCAHIIPRS